MVGLQTLLKVQLYRTSSIDTLQVTLKSIIHGQKLVEINSLVI